MLNSLALFLLLKPISSLTVEPSQSSFGNLQKFETSEIESIALKKTLDIQSNKLSLSMMEPIR